MLYNNEDIFRVIPKENNTFVPWKLKYLFNFVWIFIFNNTLIKITLSVISEASFNLAYL